VNEFKTLDVSHLAPYEISAQAPLWWGQLCITFIEGSMFLILIAAYLYTRLRLDIWPPPGEHLPGIALPTLALIPLLASAYGSYLASEGAKQDNRRKMIGGMALNLILAGVFFYMRLVEWHSLNFNWKADINGSYVWAFLSLHSFDFVGDCVFTLVLLISVASGRFGEKQRLGIHVDSIVWYFLVLIWLPIYFVIYWGPRVMESTQ
jgi:heme/copper-type cytochrome/quinol oxidase subunit 3